MAKLENIVYPSGHTTRAILNKSWLFCLHLGKFWELLGFFLFDHLVTLNSPWAPNWLYKRFQNFPPSLNINKHENVDFINKIIRRSIMLFYQLCESCTTWSLPISPPGGAKLKEHTRDFLWSRTLCRRREFDSNQEDLPTLVNL